MYDIICRLNTCSWAFQKMFHIFQLPHTCFHPPKNFWFSFSLFAPTTNENKNNEIFFPNYQVFSLYAMILCSLMLLIVLNQQKSWENVVWHLTQANFMNGLLAKISLQIFSYQLFYNKFIFTVVKCLHNFSSSQQSNIFMQERFSRKIFHLYDKLLQSNLLYSTNRITKTLEIFEWFHNHVEAKMSSRGKFSFEVPQTGVFWNKRHTLFLTRASNMQNFLWVALFYHRHGEVCTWFNDKIMESLDCCRMLLLCRGNNITVNSIFR